MAFVYLPEAVLASLPSKPLSQNIERSAMSKTMATASRKLRAALRTDILTTLQSGTMYEPSTVLTGVKKWISSLEVSPVNRSLSLARTKDQVTRETSGRTPGELLAKYDLGSRSWKTSQISLFTNTLDEYRGTWPRSAILSNMTLWAQGSLAHHIPRIDCGYWLPCPLASDHKGGHTSRHRRGNFYNLRDWFSDNYNLLYPPAEVVEWLSGWPMGWTDLAPLETDGFLKWWRTFSGREWNQPRESD